MRYVIAIVGLLALVALLGGIKFKQISTLIEAGAQAQKLGPPPEAVGTAVSKQETWGGELSAVGSVTAARGVPVSNESPGTVTKIHFESGDLVRAGQVLVELDTSVERAQLASLQAKQQLATVSLERSRKLDGREAISKAQLDSDEATLKGTTADMSALQAQIERKTVRAPFAGRLGIRTVNLGQYMNPGTPVTVLQALGSVYVDFTLPQQRLADVKVRTSVRATVAGVNGGQTFTGTVAAVDPTIDSATRTIHVRATVPNKDEKLRPGMFVNVTVLLTNSDGSVVVAPATAIIHAPFGDSVFVVESKSQDGHPVKVVRQQFVRLGPARGDYVAIADGVKAGQELVTEGAFKLRNGSTIMVNNTIKPATSINPSPENR